LLEPSNMPRRLINGGINDVNAKLGRRGSGEGHVTYFRNFGIHSISREQLELETSNLASRFITDCTNKRLEPSNMPRRLINSGSNDGNAKLGRRGLGKGHVTYFRNFGIHSTACLKKNIPDIFSCNSRKHCRIFIMFGTLVTEKVSNQ